MKPNLIDGDRDVIGVEVQRSKVYIVVLNWNRALDTIECIESLLRCSYKNIEIVVCDNGSDDDSFELIKKWVISSLDQHSAEMATDRTDFTRQKKKYRFIEDLSKLPKLSPDTNAIVTLIQTGSNLGFAGGNNIGIQYVVDNFKFDYIFLLNNDTTVSQDAITKLVRRMDSDPRIGICGATLAYYYSPTRVQALGGVRYNKWTGLGKQIGNGTSVESPISVANVESQMSYVSGAAMMLSSSFIRNIGVMSEDYFLYFEELDWVTRAQGKFRIAYEAESIVYHKEGGTIGTSSNGKGNKSSLISDFYLARGRLLYTRKFYPYALPTVYLVLIAMSIKRLFEGEYGKAKILINVVLGKKKFR